MANFRVVNPNPYRLLIGNFQVAEGDSPIEILTGESPQDLMVSILANGRRIPCRHVAGRFFDQRLYVAKLFRDSGNLRFMDSERDEDAVIFVFERSDLD